MQGYHRGARLVGLCRLTLGSGALSECLQRSQRHHFQQSLTSRPGQTEKERKRSRSGEISEKVGSKQWGTMGGWQESAAISSLYTPFNHTTTTTHIHTHGQESTDYLGLKRDVVHKLRSHTWLYLYLWEQWEPLWTCLTEFWSGRLKGNLCIYDINVFFPRLSLSLLLFYIFTAIEIWHMHVTFNSQEIPIWPSSLLLHKINYRHNFSF